MAEGFDGHAHVFAPHLPLVTPRRYTPGYAATVEQFIAHLDACDLLGGLLTQPSFLGTDNRHMLEAVARYSNRLRAVIVVDPHIEAQALDDMAQAGAVGIRLNLEGRELPDLSTGPWPSLFGELAKRNWHVEIHRSAGDLPGLLAPVIASGVRLCIDHFGRPDPRLGADDPGFRALLDMATSGRVWVKVSAAYRIGGFARGEELAPRLLDELLEHFPVQRLIWASDWPHTQFETQVSYASCFNTLARWGIDEVLAQRLRRDAVAALIDTGQPGALSADAP